MATTDRSKQYSQSAIYGSLAYDLADPFAAYNAGTAAPEFPYDSPGEVPARPVPRTEPRTDRRAKRRAQAEAFARAEAENNKQAIAPFAVLGVLCVAVLIVFTMVARIQLNAVADEAVSLRNQLSELKVEQNRLRIDYESAFNLTEVEEYAIRHLGMQQPRRDQIYYIDSAAPDRAEILGEDRGSLGEDGTAVGIAVGSDMVNTGNDAGEDVADADETAEDDVEDIVGEAPATDTQGKTVA